MAQRRCPGTLPSGVLLEALPGILLLGPPPLLGRDWPNHLYSFMGCARPCRQVEAAHLCQHVDDISGPSRSFEASG